MVEALHLLSPKKAKVAVADWKENDKMVDLIKELVSEAIFLNGTSQKPMKGKQWLHKRLPHLADWIMRSTIPESRMRLLLPKIVRRKI